ncbi:hypothetical protein VB796_02700 [Arcicella sp. LKC2W]|uniref:hypothetical protein n=1 Tax=Arcicella sp. LKC2W TaxID=2984198 RepID=UPI002B20B715|nr:hypothetical protein [Arcicella sp. LKC2W]MEA5457925.1 hypothetical protein [Arcicella sp. LKC2W]
MATKSKLNGFVFKKLEEINNGLQIPTGNAVQPTESIIETTPQPKTIQTEHSNLVSTFQKLKIDNTAFTPMTNVVPTIENGSEPNKPIIEQKFKRLSRKEKQRVTHDDLNWNEFSALPTKQDKIVYLSMRGWSLKTEMRSNGRFHYATKYIRNTKGKLEKKRLYLGSVNRELSEGITVKSKYFSKLSINTK